MKKLYPLLAALLLLASSAMAQLKEENKKPSSFSKYIGVKGGVNFSNFYGRDLEGAEMLTGINAGLYMLYMQSEMFGIQPEIQYSMQGTSDGEQQLEMNYAVVPVMLKFYPTDLISLQAGPYAAFLLSSKFKGQEYNGTKGQDFGLAYGITAGNENNFTFSIRHHLGFSKIFSSYSNIKNQAFQLSVGYCFNRD